VNQIIFMTEVQNNERQGTTMKFSTDYCILNKTTFSHKICPMKQTMRKVCSSIHRANSA